MSNFQIPPGLTTDEAQDRMASLLIDIRKIEADLGDVSRETMNGYDEWRKRAKYAWSQMMTEYRALKEWVRRDRIAGTGNVSGNIASAIGRLHEALAWAKQAERLLKAARAFLDADTEESWAELEGAVLAMEGGEASERERGEGDSGNAGE